MWLDSHCHLAASEFDEDRSEVLERATADGVDAFVAIGSGYGIRSNSPRGRTRCWRSPGFRDRGCSSARGQRTRRRRLRGWLDQLLEHPRVVAVGECGLDYHYMKSDRAIQRSVFAEQVATARERSLPVTIHVRGDEPNAYDELLDIWQSEGGGDLSGVLHCYTGTLEFAKRAMDAGFFVSFSGILTFKNDRGLRGVAKEIPLDRLMVETDAPLLAPQGFRGKRNEPARVSVVGEVLAGVLEKPIEEVARATSANARALFRLDEVASVV